MSCHNFEFIFDSRHTGEEEILAISYTYQARLRHEINNNQIHFLMAKLT